ncbi:ileal sodium/bile acid cotransporter-like [Gigantopelta aegis]|uniref:ileal sodium/bile acid cotransporter-like n=1 Tax=Gigantopelta aegis TaxID=1735272 RepID=UPI001B88BE5B|nr:ileal sodium/bile acid cotransporter-like [Gigantopelta aegis]
MAGLRVICVVHAVLFAAFSFTQAVEPPANISLQNDVTLNITDVIGDIMLDIIPADTVTIIMYSETMISVNYTLRCYNRNITHLLKIHTLNHDVAYLKGMHQYNVSCADLRDSQTDSDLQDNDLQDRNFTLHSGDFNLTVYADLIGRTWLVFDTFSINGAIGDKPFENISSSGESRRIYRYKVVVIRIRRLIDYIFRGVVYVFVIGTTVGMGCKTDLDVVKKVLKKPIAPLIGLFCQYVGMPLIAFGVANLINLDNPAIRLGIFACGICPGGGLSNIYSYLLGGDVSLSITMTCISTVAALAMVPLWMFTLGQTFADDTTTISIPFANILLTLATVIVPLFVGLFVKYKCQKLAKLIIKIIKPVSIVTILFLIGFGVYTNLWIFRLFKPSTVLAGCLLPYIGYVTGGLIAFICRQPWYRVKTIAIETGIQNTMIAYLLLQFSLPVPDGDLAAVGPVASSVMTPLPLFVVVIVYLIYKRCKKKYGTVSDGEETGAEMNGTDDRKKDKDKNKNKNKEKNKSDKKNQAVNGSTEKDEKEAEELLDKVSSM